MPMVDSQNMKRIESEHTTMEKHQFTKEGSKRKKGKRELQNSQKIIRWH